MPCIADVEYLRERWESAAKLAAGLTAAGLALQYAAQAALSSFFGAFAAPALFIAAAAFFAAAIIEAGYASSAKTGFDKASTVANSARIAFLAAETQMQNNCTSEQNKACKDLLVECP